ncbi:hypothetical protein AB0O01_35050 [Streptomyces sp. NPDC093252]|uniref:hypothetical protein n=1 Tax=Streptomyces sp. NPDC093252 TaxID=3154980 RepID=UPI00341C268B
MWADAHVDYACPTGPDTERLSGPLAEQTAAWHARMTEAAPNGPLLLRNGMFDALRNAGTHHLLHVTPSMDRIRHTGELRPSGGCLVGSVYCAPLAPTASGLRMHNLAEFILTREVPTTLALSRRPGRTATPLVLEVDQARHGFRGLSGIDYLRLGPIHLRNHLNREHLMWPRERAQLHEEVLGRVKNSVEFLRLAAALATGPEPAEHAAFPRLLAETLPQLPVLGYVYFEALSEYLMLYSRSARTRRLAEHGEFNNWLSKQLLFEGFPGTTGRFDLTRFRPDFARLDGFLTRIDPTVEPAHARAHLTARISYLTVARLLGPEILPGMWHRVRWNLPHAARFFGPLLGHLIHRELRRFDRYPDFHRFYDGNQAFQVWNYWNQLGIALPFNGTFPKGEIGINPAYPELSYRVWRAELGDDRLLHLTERLPLRLTPHLVGPQHTLLRSSSVSAKSRRLPKRRPLVDSGI